MKTQNKIRNWNAVAAHQRNSAGPMKDKRQARHSSKSYANELRLMEEMQENDSPHDYP
jgi:hypothetical protein